MFVKEYCVKYVGLEKGGDWTLECMLFVKEYCVKYIGLEKGGDWTLECMMIIWRIVFNCPLDVACLYNFCSHAYWNRVTSNL